MASNRTLNFLGYAYGNSSVSLAATINGVSVFNGEIATLDEPLPSDQVNMSNAPTLFSVENTDLFPTTFGGSYPMSVTVTGGYGAVFGPITSNYMLLYTPTTTATLANSSIQGNTLTIGSVVSGTVKKGQVLSGNGISNGPYIVDGSDNTWTVSQSQSVTDIDISATTQEPTAGNATSYLGCYDGTPVNSEGTPDSRSSVYIDGVQQVPPLPVSRGVQSWTVLAGSTITYNLNVSTGNDNIGP